MLHSERSDSIVGGNLLLLVGQKSALHGHNIKISFEIIYLAEIIPLLSVSTNTSTFACKLGC